MDSNEYCIQVQQNILNHTVYDEIAKRYPPPIRYTRQFLKQLITLFEIFLKKKSDYFYYDIYEIYTNNLKLKYLPVNRSLFMPNCNQNNCFDELVNLIEMDPSIGFVTHIINSLKVSLLESNQIVCTGTTGFRSWPAAVHLLEFLTDSNQQTINDIQWNRKEFLNVIELGAGTGLLGIGLLKSHFVSNGRYIFTDHNDNVLQRIILNLCSNDITLSDAVTVDKLDWFDVKLSDIGKNNDLILASDVIFDPQLVEPFVQLLSLMFDQYRNNDVDRRYPDCLICCTCRNPQILRHFQVVLEKFYLKAEIIAKQDKAKWMKSIIKHLTLLKQNDSLDMLSVMDTDSIMTIIYRILPVC